jgi:hypothetical protein
MIFIGKRKLLFDVKRTRKAWLKSRCESPVGEEKRDSSSKNRSMENRTSTAQADPSAPLRTGAFAGANAEEKTPACFAGNDGSKDLRCAGT